MTDHDNSIHHPKHVGSLDMRKNNHVRTVVSAWSAPSLRNGRSPPDFHQHCLRQNFSGHAGYTAHAFDSQEEYGTSGEGVDEVSSQENPQDTFRLMKKMTIALAEFLTNDRRKTTMFHDFPK
jgi:hypothetical protein